MKPLIKWPGGKSGELPLILPAVPGLPAGGRYLEPFFGGGALYFRLCPRAAAVNDLSPDLMNFYAQVRARDPIFHSLLLCYERSLRALLALCDGDPLFLSRLAREEDADSRRRISRAFAARLFDGPEASAACAVVAEPEVFLDDVAASAADKARRTARNSTRSVFSDDDLRDNIATGFAAGFYTYFRRVFNHDGVKLSPQARAACFFYIREYCYGSMFRYNAAGKFNIPYGGRSYNRKDFRAKIDGLFTPEVSSLLGRTTLYRGDFEQFFREAKPAAGDFLFLDPPYDTEFSDYEGTDFTRSDQERLAALLYETPARFLLVIKSTPFIRSLYEGRFGICDAEKRYTYSVRSRNDPFAEHLYITNYDGEASFVK